MERTYRFDTVTEYNALNNHETLHPLVVSLIFPRPIQDHGLGQKGSGLILACTAFF
jgi:hypothetical protein